MKTCGLNDREFKIVVIKKFNKTQENSDSLIDSERKKQTNKRNTLQKKIGTLKKNQIEMLALKNSMKVEE